MSPDPVLTVITPTHNRANYLIETIESVFVQNVPRLEYIIIDDGSTDNTANVVADYCSKGRSSNDTKVTYLRHDNMGETRTVNKAMRMARGEFFTIVNSDDPLLPGCLEKMINSLREQPSVLAAYPDWYVIGPQSQILSTIKLIDYDIATMFSHGGVSIGPGAVFRSSARELIGYRNPQLRYAADLDYWYRLAIAGPIIHVRETLATHRVHPQSASILDKGTRLAAETLYMFEAYSCHPLLSQKHRQLQSLAIAHGCFAAMFVSTNARHAARFLASGLLAHPTGMIARCKTHGIDNVIDLFQTLGAVRSGRTERLVLASLNARTRFGAVAPMVRGTLSDPLGMLVSAKHLGLDNVMKTIRSLPLSIGQHE